MSISQQALEDIAEDKVKFFKEFLAAEPPNENGESLLGMWEKIWDEQLKSVVVETVTGPSDDATNLVYPYEKLQAVVGNGGSWKWPRMWQRMDEIERRGTAYREGEKLNFQQPNKNPHIRPQKILVVGGGPVGLRLAIELVMGGHKVILFEKRREKRSDDGALTALGFTNRINRPHMWPFVRNDLAKLNGKDFMSRQAAYPVFTEPETSSIGIDELQLLLLKNALLLGVDFRLGAGYVDAKVQTDPDTLKPSWVVDCTYDERAAKYFGKEPGANKEVFDVLIGCDGPRSAVRDTQQKWFGNIDKRKFMDCVGIVANVQKVPRKRLRELGFEYGQEPNDMNRTRMVFKDFFAKIKKEADAELEGVIYYKASFHNYTILTPKRSDLEKHGLSGKVYSFDQGRSTAADQRADEKAKLKKYCANVLKAAGIPVDDTMSNGGFVAAPNDVMAFDFAECWNTKKSIAFNYPPADWNVSKHGEWMGKRLVPMVALAGDALLEPFWPMGLGLKRGWQAIMDTCYCVDNLYNRELFAKRKGKDTSRFSWDDHYEALQEQVEKNFEYCSRLKVGEELGKGEYGDKGMVMSQLKKIVKDAQKPMYEVEIDPWTRYEPLEKERGDDWKSQEADPKFLHPKVKKELAKIEFYQEAGTSGSGEIEYTGKALKTIEGKTIGGKGNLGYSFTRQPSIPMEPPKEKPAVAAAEIQELAMERKLSLSEKVVESKIEEHVNREQVERRKSFKGGIGQLLASTPIRRPAAMEKSQEELDNIGFVPPPVASESGVAAASEAMWDRMHEKGLSPSQEAELAHVRNMIDALTKSLASYKEAEMQLLMNGRK